MIRSQQDLLQYMRPVILQEVERFPSAMREELAREGWIAVWREWSKTPEMPLGFFRATARQRMIFVLEKNFAGRILLSVNADAALLAYHEGRISGDNVAGTT